MRALTIACLVLLGGCNDSLRVDSLAVNPNGTFVYTAQTNTVMTENDDGEAEQIRRDWLAEEVTENGMCPSGYVVEIRRLLPVPEPPSSNAHNVVYTGRCL
jgi:aerobic-type carbon monoxide dehydrogenase small subunit (CoxS/CutS family)